MVKKILNRFFIDGLTGMSYGLFATLIIGTILQQIGTLISGEIGTYLYQFGKIAAGMTSAGIGMDKRNICVVGAARQIIQL